MKNSFKKVLKLFKYLAILFTVVLWAYMIIDDYVLWKEYGMSVEKFAFWVAWFVLFFLAFSIYYWAICSVVIFIYHKAIKRK